MTPRKSIPTANSSSSTAPRRTTAPRRPRSPANTAAIDYAAQESGFVAGFACALQLKEGEFGALFGQEIPPTKLFKTGFQQGVIYANENFGTNIRMKEENFVWSGSFSDAALGQQITAQLFNSGCNLVYCACGTTALGGFNEAKVRAEKGEEVWVVGCDVDQYEDGLLEDGRSVTLTSTMKNLGQLHLRHDQGGAGRRIRRRPADHL